MADTFFNSQKNYLKRDESSGDTTMAAPATSAYNAQLYVTNYTVTHNLGYVPLFRAYFEPFNDGVIWPPMSTRFKGYTTDPLTGNTGPALYVWADSTKLYLQLFYNNNSLSGTYPVYWVIYKDFALS